MNLQTVNAFLSIASNLAIALGLPIAIISFLREKARERTEREYGTYNALDDKYIHFLELCLEHPELDIVDVRHSTSLSLPNKESEDYQESILYLILISIMERSYLMYKDQCTEIKKNQWEGWVGYMRDYCRKDSFRNKWDSFSEQFDTKFVTFMNKEVIQNLERGESTKTST